MQKYYQWGLAQRRKARGGTFKQSARLQVLSILDAGLHSLPRSDNLLDN